jgi:haloalkane dehalogenase
MARPIGRVEDSPSSLRRILIDAYRTPDERFENLPGYPFAPSYTEQEGLRMHYVDAGEGDPVLLLHGEPTWAFLYRKVIAELIGTHRCVAPDYFGFGRSDKPTDPAFYTYDRHVESIARLVTELDLRNITLVVQDWGGPVGFRFAVENPERIARLVVLNTGIGARAPSEEWLRFQEFMRRVGNEIVAGQLIRLSLVQPVDDDVIAAYDAPFPVPESRTGIVAFPELVPTSREHPNAEPMLAVKAALGQLDRPSLVLFSDSDPIFSRRAAEVMAETLAYAELDPPLAGAGHFLQEDQGEAVGRRIRDLLV